MTLSLARSFRAAALPLGLLALARCTDPTVIGGELIDADDLPLEVTDTLPVGFRTVLADTSAAGGIQFLGTGTSPIAAAANFGCFDDPVLGTTRGAVGFELIVAPDRDELEDLIDLPVDSVVLTVPLAPGAQIGRTDAVSSVRVVGAAPGTVALDESLLIDTLEGDGVVYGAAAFTPSRDSVDVVRYERDDSTTTLRRGPLVRIPLDATAFTSAAIAPARALYADSEDGEGDEPLDDSLFIARFPGLILEPDPDAACSATLPAIDLFSGRLPELGVTVYVTLDGSPVEYRLPLRRGAAAGEASLRPSYAHDYTGTAAAVALEGDLAEGRAFVQGLDGLSTEVSLPVPTADGPLAVNYAVLDVPVVTDGLVEPLTRIVPRVRNSVGDLVPFSAGRVDDTGFAPREGGFVVKVAPYGGATDSVEVYQFILTTYLQEVTAGDRDPTIILVARNQDITPQRSILRVEPDEDGPGARLLLATTTLPN